jgi:hypothetical protein
MFTHVRTGRAVLISAAAVLASVAVEGPVTASTTGPALSHWNCSDVWSVSGGRAYGLDCIGSGTGPGVISGGPDAFQCQSFAYGNPTRGYGCTPLP